MRKGNGRLKETVACRQLPQLAEYFAAQFPLPGFAVADHASTGADDADPQAAEHGSQVSRATVDSPAWFADPLDVPDHPFAVGAVFQVQEQVAGRTSFDRFFAPVPNISFAFEHLGHAFFDFGQRHVHERALNTNRITDAGKHVSDGVGHHRGGVSLGNIRVELLPARLADTWNHSLIRQLAETNTANAKLAVDRPRPAAELAPRFLPRTKLGRPIRLCNFRFAGHEKEIPTGV